MSSFGRVGVIAPKLTSALQQFESWAVHNGQGQFHEHPSGGLLSRFFDQVYTVRDSEDSDPYRFPQPERTDYCQLFLMRKDNDRRSQETIDRIRGTMRRRVVLPVFHFRNGQVMFLASDEDAQTTVRRCERQLSSMEYWVIVDREGKCRSNADIDRLWDRTDLEDLVFDDGGD
jgi:hypothetical protein